MQAEAKAGNVELGPNAEMMAAVAAVTPLLRAAMATHDAEKLAIL